MPLRRNGDDGCRRQSADVPVPAANGAEATQRSGEAAKSGSSALESGERSHAVRRDSKPRRRGGDNCRHSRQQQAGGGTQRRCDAGSKEDPKHLFLANISHEVSIPYEDSHAVYTDDNPFLSPPQLGKKRPCLCPG